MKRSIRIEDDLLRDIQNIAEEEHKSINQVISDALKYYRDYHYMQHKATLINDQIIGIVKAVTNTAIQQINARGYKILSELAIQQGITAAVLANNLEIDRNELSVYRLQAVDALKNAQRLISLESLVDEL